MSAPNGYTQHNNTIEVPKGTGIEGFIQSIRQILKLPRVQDIQIGQGKISYSFFLRDGEEDRELAINFDDIMPMALTRNSEVAEVAFYPKSDNCPTALIYLFRAAAIDHLHPIGFIISTNSYFWSWQESYIPSDSKTSISGVPVYADRYCPDEALLLCAGYKRDATLAEMVKAYKIWMPKPILAVNP